MKKVRAGEPLRIPASTFNTFIDAARDYRNRTHGMGAGAAARAPGVDTGRILVRNDSGADADRFGILGIDSIVISPTDNADEFKNRPILSLIAPAVPDHSENFVVLAEPLRHEATVADRPIGEAVIDGITVVLVDVQDADHEFAVVVNAQSTKLQSASNGPVQIIYKEAGTGDKWAVVRLGGKMVDTASGVASISFDEWYDVKGDEDWFTVDTRNWSGRWIRVAAGYANAEPAADLVWEDNGTVFHKEHWMGGWVAQEGYRWFYIYMNTNIVTQDITKIIVGSGHDFYLRMNSDGTLQAKIENWDHRQQVRISILAGQRVVYTDAVEIT